MRFIYYAVLLVSLSGYAQDHLKFQKEVNNLTRKFDTIWDRNRETIVFTGSSSVRLWGNLPELFPEHYIVNTAFGGSRSSDLLAYTEELILRFNPKKVFIYEGDNDIADRKRIKVILRNLQQIIDTIKANIPAETIVLIAAKPSPLRWKKRKKYERLNHEMEMLCAADPKLEFANVWDSMLKDEKVIPDLFLPDRLHMNEKGYALWYDVIKKYMN